MSTNKTEHYGLHVWEAVDTFLREEMNENFGAIDGVLPGVKRLRTAAGNYLGDGKSNRLFKLPFRPKVVAISAKPNTTCPMSVICTDGAEVPYVAITEEGFTVSSYLNSEYTGTSGYISGQTLNPYGYIALGWEE